MLPPVRLNIYSREILEMINFKEDTEQSMNKNPAWMISVCVSLDSVDDIIEFVIEMIPSLII